MCACALCLHYLGLTGSACEPALIVKNNSRIEGVAYAIGRLLKICAAKKITNFRQLLDFNACEKN